MSSRHWFEWHSWLGTTTGLLLFVICWSGTIAVFSDEIDWLLNPAERVLPADTMRSWGDWQQAAEHAFPGLRVDSILAPRSSDSAAELWLETTDGQILRTYINPYTAEVTAQTNYFNVQRFFRSLHMCLFDPGGGGFGYYFVMAFSLVLAGSVITSLLFYKRWWQRFLSLRIRETAHANWSEYHKLSGLWSLWFIVLIAITGVWYLLEFTGIDFGYPQIQPLQSSTNAQARPTDQLLEAARKAAPGLRFDQVYLPGGYYGNVAVLHGQGNAVLVRNRANTVIIDAHSATPMLVRRAETLSWPMRWVDTADPLHFGNFAGLASKTLWFVFGLLLSALTLTGAYLHVCRQCRLHHAKRHRHVLIAYGLTVAVLCAATIGAVNEYASYAPLPASPATWWFIGAWLTATLAILSIWMYRLR